MSSNNVPNLAFSHMGFAVSDLPKMEDFQPDQPDFLSHGQPARLAQPASDAGG